MELWFQKGGWASKRGRRKAERLHFDQIKKIAVIRHAAVGDMLIARPFLLELRKHFPDADITLSLVSNYTYGAPEDLVGRVHVVYGNDRRDVSLREQYKKVKELGSQDIIFDLAATSRSFWVCALTKAKLKIGFPYDWYRNPMFYDVSILRSDFKFEAETLLDMLSILGLKTSYPLDFALPEKSKEGQKPYIVYFTSASTREKCWPDDSFSSLIEKMSRQFPDIQHVVLEGVGENESVTDVMEPLSGYSNVHAIKPMAFDKTINFINNAELLVSNDTGIRNFAIATSTSTVGIFFSTIPFRYWPRDGLHEVVFNSDSSVPSVEDVFKITESHLKKVAKL